MLKELIRKDLKIFIADKRGMIVSIAVPVALASFMALIFGGVGSGGGGGTKMNAVPLAIVDHDQSDLSRLLVLDLAASGPDERLRDRRPADPRGGDGGPAPAGARLLPLARARPAGDAARLVLPDLRAEG